jgi:hypothetical protein
MVCKTEYVDVLKREFGEITSVRLNDRSVQEVVRIEFTTG